MKAGDDGVLVMRFVENPSEWEELGSSHVISIDMDDEDEDEEDEWDGREREDREDPMYCVFRHYPALAIGPNTIKSVTGAGDTFAGALLAQLARHPTKYLTPAGMDDLVDRAQEAALLTLQSEEAVSSELSPSLLSR